MRHVGLHIFVSPTGATGRSSLAIITTKLLASRGRHPVLFDSDITGSSLLGTLKLRAPVLASDNDEPGYWLAPTDKWHDLAATHALQDARRVRSETLGRPTVRGVPPFTNDALLYDPTQPGGDCRPDALLWAPLEGSDRYLPASPSALDSVHLASLASSTSRKFGWLHRVWQLLRSLVHHRPATTDVVFDVPAGTRGIPHEALLLAATIPTPPPGFPVWPPNIQWRPSAAIITTPDPASHQRAVDYWLTVRQRLPAAKVLVNKAPGPLEAARTALLASIPPAAASAGLARNYVLVPRLQALQDRLSADRDVDLDDNLSLFDALPAGTGGTA